MKKSFLLLMTTCLIACTISGCSKENEIVIPSENWISLSEIPENDSFALLPLLSTKWKLVGFADEEQKIFKYAEPSTENTYLLVFKENGELTGTTSANEMFGEYKVKNSEVNITNWGGGKISEVHDGNMYRESFLHIYYYRINSKGLILYYTENKSMLFHPID